MLGGILFRPRESFRAHGQHRRSDREGQGRAPVQERHHGQDKQVAVGLRGGAMARGVQHGMS
jgi:hypothetical protein